MLRASCPLQYEAVMDRVQKSKLSLHKKAMEVSLEGWLGLGCGSQEPWDRAGLRLPSSNRHSGLSGSWSCTGCQGAVQISPGGSALDPCWGGGAPY